MTDLRGLHLRCQHGSFGWGGLKSHPVAGGGYSVTAPCELGEHHLRPDGDGWIVGAQPYVFASETEAQRALDAWREQGQE
jgi:hypothetical protein